MNQNINDTVALLCDQIKDMSKDMSKKDEQIQFLISRIQGLEDSKKIFCDYDNFRKKLEQK